MFIVINLSKILLQFIEEEIHGRENNVRPLSLSDKIGDPNVADIKTDND